MNFIYIAAASIGIGYAGFLIMLYFLPKRLQNDKVKQRNDILQDAQIVAQQRRQAEGEKCAEDLLILNEQFETDLQVRTDDARATEEALMYREQSITQEETRLQKIEKDIDLKKQKTETAQKIFQEKQDEIDNAQKQLVAALEKAAHTSADQILKQLKDQLIDARIREQQKSLKYLEEEIESSQRRIANRTIARAMSRYAPEFYWPKSNNLVELTDPKIAEKVASENERLLLDLKEKAEIEIDVIVEEQSHHPPVIKLAGGAGINREAVRLALNEMLANGTSQWHKAHQVYQKYRDQLEQEAIRLGWKAVREVQLEDIHPEIQKLVGYLNWRTSYRQNQWYHTVEVAKLAGIVANEVGCDPQEAKRVGLLHDIGKALDYKIDGSHAVISGDYADRFGENRLICDTVMSHHNDLVIETPLAYVLKTADTLSGARPGARVNLEEGYQTRLTGIDSAVRSFTGVVSVAIMNGAREVHVEVNNRRVRDEDLAKLSHDIARKVEQEVAFPGEIKILVTRRYEATAVA